MFQGNQLTNVCSTVDTHVKYLLLLPRLALGTNLGELNSVHTAMELVHNVYVSSERIMDRASVCVAMYFNAFSLFVCVKIRTCQA